MEFRNLKKLAEVQARLRPVLDELGLEAKLTAPMMSERIVFSNADGSVKHAVEIIIKDNGNLSPPLDTWEGSYMTRYKMEEVPIGYTGWSYASYKDPANSKQFDDNVDETFGYIEECLRSYPLIRRGETHDLLTQDEAFGKAFAAIEERIGDISSSELTCGRVDGGMSMSFADEYSGDKWEIIFKSFAAALFINGVKVADAESTRLRDVESMFNKAIKDNHIQNLENYGM